jgi:putative transcriptional regulator
VLACLINEINPETANKKTKDKMQVVCIEAVSKNSPQPLVDVARETDMHRNTITLLYNETATRVDLETIDRLCRFFRCSVSDLFEFIEIESKDTPEGH